MNDSHQNVKKDFDNARREKIRKDFNKLRDRCFKPKIKVRRNLNGIENKNNIFTQKINKIAENLHELEKLFLN